MDRKELIEKARELLACGALSKEAADAIKGDLPELKESEDERIRKEMLDYFKDKKEKLYHLCFECGDVRHAPFSEAKQIDDFLAYFEKQKEQKPVEIHVENPNIQKLDPNVVVETRTDGTNPNVVNESITYQPVEWSEEDERYRNAIINSLNGWHNYLRLSQLTGLAPSAPFIDEERAKQIAWLKSLRPQQKTEGIRGKSKEIPSNWKPSEEQMTSLARASNRCISKEDTKILCTLIMDLEKL